jgi:hypothetical protein
MIAKADRAVEADGAAEGEDGLWYGRWKGVWYVIVPTYVGEKAVKWALEIGDGFEKRGTFPTLDVAETRARALIDAEEGK